ncbi:MAG: hypothetical protein L0L57_09070 [Alkalibacterium sp.]|nr:hypothetical protein [Staphylococcus equorum]MDN6730303.1 hypothetical protein [Alkalibacterium sp.]MDN6749782.1 hypothetical protein [Staphylococcus equorum]
MRRENEYILNALKNNRGFIAAQRASDLNKADSKSITQIIQDAPEDLDKCYIEESFEKLIDKTYLTKMDPEGHYMITGRCSEIKQFLKEE